MFTTAVERPGTGEAAIRLPWFVKVSPEFYDDACDTGYGWEGWAFNADDAVAQALDECHLDNDRDSEQREEDIDPARAKVHVAEIDFRRLAGPLVHWARTMGGWESRLWDAMEAAVKAAKLEAEPMAWPADESDPWHVGEMPGDGGLIVRDQNGLEVSRHEWATDALEAVREHNDGDGDG